MQGERSSGKERGRGREEGRGRGREGGKGEWEGRSSSIRKGHRDRFIDIVGIGMKESKEGRDAGGTYVILLN